MSEPLGVVIFSGVRHAQNYCRILERHPGFEVIGVFEAPDAPSWALDDAQQLADQQQIPRLDSIPTDTDLVVVCSEPTRHAACAHFALSSGHHVLIDKPAATNLHDVLELRSLSTQLGLVCTSVNRTFLSGTQRAKRLIDDGHIGFPRSVDTEFLSDGAQFSVAVERPELVVDPALSGGGEIINFMGYCVDEIRLLTGCDPVEVFAFASSAFSDLHRAAGVEDICVASLLLTNGVVATVTVGRIPAAPSSGAGASSIRIIGSHGHLMIDHDKPAVTVHRTDGTESDLAAGPSAEVEAINGVLTNIHQAIVASTPLTYRIEDAAIAIATIEATYESVAHHRPVAVRSIAIAQAEPAQ